MRHVKRVSESGPKFGPKFGNANARGEFVVCLPAASAVYVIDATAPGFTCDTKELCSVADERRDVVLHIFTPGEINRQPGQRGIAP